MLRHGSKYRQRRVRTIEYGDKGRRDASSRASGVELKEIAMPKGKARLRKAKKDMIESRIWNGSDSDEYSKAVFQKQRAEYQVARQHGVNLRELEKDRKRRDKYVNKKSK